MKILGIQDGHGASTCLIIDGEIKVVVEEERFVREKGCMGYPKKAIDWQEKKCHELSCITNHRNVMYVIIHYYKNNYINEKIGCNGMEVEVDKTQIDNQKDEHTW